MDWNSINIYEIWNIVSYPFNIIYVLVIIFIIILLILENGSPTKTIAWILIFILLPLVGFILYFFFGRNFRKEKIFSRLGIENYNNINERSTEQLHLFNQEENIMNKQAADKINIINLLLKNANALLSP
ncbi:MAG: PLDc N-terminal domain-containing protein, partial [Bacteroidales bacterium]|nr:PLDc N-terminal domain-containing protein [Bacteroidales bacterium]